MRGVMHGAFRRVAAEVIAVSEGGGEAGPDHYDPVDPVYRPPRHEGAGRRWGPRNEDEGGSDDMDERDARWVMVLGLVIRVALLLVVLFVAFREIRKRQERIAPHPGRELGEGEKSHWRTALFDCLGRPGTAFKATFCAPILIAANRAELDGRRPTFMDMAAAYTSPLGHLWANQRTFQRRLEEPENGLADCAQVVCCAPCVTARHTMELDAAAEDAGHPLHGPAEGPQDRMPPAEGVPLTKAHPYHEGYASVNTKEVP